MTLEWNLLEDPEILGRPNWDQLPTYLKGNLTKILVRLNVLEALYLFTQHLQYICISLLSWTWDVPRRKELVALVLILFIVYVTQNKQVVSFYTQSSFIDKTEK